MKHSRRGSIFTASTLIFCFLLRLNAVVIGSAVRQSTKQVILAVEVGRVNGVFVNWTAGNEPTHEHGGNITNNIEFNRVEEEGGMHLKPNWSSYVSCHGCRLVVELDGCGISICVAQERERRRLSKMTAGSCLAVSVGGKKKKRNNNNKKTKKRRRKEKKEKCFLHRRRRRRCRFLLAAPCCGARMADASFRLDVMTFGRARKGLREEKLNGFSRVIHPTHVQHGRSYRRHSLSYFFFFFFLFVPEPNHPACRAAGLLERPKKEVYTEKRGPRRNGNLFLLCLFSSAPTFPSFETCAAFFLPQCDAERGTRSNFKTKQHNRPCLMLRGWLPSYFEI